MGVVGLCGGLAGGRLWGGRVWSGKLNGLAFKRNRKSLGRWAGGPSVRFEGLEPAVWKLLRTGII